MKTNLANCCKEEVIMGSQEPSVRIGPEYLETDGVDANEIIALGGVQLDDWQKEILNDWMARDEYGQWASPTCGGSVPRQNGKSFLLQGRMEAGMLLLNEQVIYTAHLQKTATETFEEMRDFFESRKMRKYVSEIKSAIGREQIILKSGARVKFLARTRNGGRGQHGDLLIIDEAQEIDDTAQSSFLPAISASANPQTIYTGTPPGSDVTADVFKKIRQKALSRKSNIAWFEYSVPEIGDVTDKKRWAMTNPALGRRIRITTVQGEVEQMDQDTFARERLGWWPPEVTTKEEKAIDEEAWMACASDELKPEGKTAYGVKFTPDGAEVVLAGAVIADTGKVRISLIERKNVSLGLRWLAKWLNDRYEKASCVVIDGRNGADVLVDMIQDTWKFKNSVIRPKSTEVIAACSTLVNDVNENSLTWFSAQEALSESAVSSVKRPFSGGWGFGGEDSAPIEACSLALWGVKNSKRNPGRKMRIG